ncbi:uncharacterized protein [Diadema antillarum]|uniref:uncharacterized protein n=1 Tax=Diadema antillarum TaxID=105358 RepID=UPI003A853B5F
MNVCSPFTVRLVGPSGGKDGEGRVEILCDGEWGTVCDGGWDIKEAHAVCRQLGYTSAASVHVGAHFGEGTGPIWIDDYTYCPTGNERSLLECTRWPWGCFPSYLSTSCGHGQDVGVRCEGQRNQTTVDEYFESVTYSEGFTYGVDRYSYYDMKSEFTFTPTSASDGDILQCHVYGVVRSVTLQILGGQPDPVVVAVAATPRPGQPPLPNILSIEAVELRGRDNMVNLVISCQVNFTDQPFPYLHTYTIEAGNTTLSSSSSGSAILSPRPNECINLTCSSTNGVGSTSASLWHCPKDPPPNDIISVTIQSHGEEDGKDIFMVTCHVDPDDQPSPPIHTYKIAVDDMLVSISPLPNVTLNLRPTTCINVVCTGLNDYGKTTKRESYCSTSAGTKSS